MLYFFQNINGGSILKKHKFRILAWIPAIAVMAVIFMFSAEPADKSNETSASFIENVVEVAVPEYKDMTPAEKEEFIDSLQHTVRKCAHAAVYVLLSVCLFVAFALYVRSPAAVALAAWLSATVYAAADELHQLFVDGRSCELTDVLIDSGGAAIGALLSLIVLAIIIHHRRKRSIL